MKINLLNVASGIQGAFDSQMKPQFMSIVNGVVMPTIWGILIVALIVKGVFVWKDFHNGGGLHLTGVIVLFFSLVIAVSAPFWMWGVIGW